MLYSVSSYSFSQYINKGLLNQLQCVDKAVEMGFDAIEIVGIHPHDGSSASEYAEAIRKRAEELGIALSCYTVGADFLNGSGGDLRAEINRVKEQVDIAALLGVKFMRHDATVGESGENARTFKEALNILSGACREITEYAKKFEIRTMVENHGYFCQGSRRMLQLYNSVKHRNFSLLCDIGNFAVIDEDSLAASKEVAPYTAFVHAKDFKKRSAENPPENESGWFKLENGSYLQGCSVGKGEILAGECIKALSDSGFDGYISIEYEGPEDCIKGIAGGLEFLRSL